MGKRDGKAAKAKRAERRGKGSLKTEQKTAIAEGKQERRNANARDEEDLDALLKEFANAQEKQVAVKEEVAPPPSPRANGTLTAHPTKDELIFFGGEHFDGKVNRFHAELYRYIVKKNEWKRVSSPTAPPPRSSHQVVTVPTDGGQLFLFGGEFSSPSQQKFHHFRDFWMLDLATWSWEQACPLRARCLHAANTLHTHARTHAHCAYAAFTQCVRYMLQCAASRHPPHCTAPHRTAPHRCVCVCAGAGQERALGPVGTPDGARA